MLLFLGRKCNLFSESNYGVKNNISKILLVVFFAFALFSANQVYGMFNQQGQWICSQEIDIEISYYQSYTERFQNAIDEVYLSEGSNVAKSYFDFAIEGEVIGQDWPHLANPLIFYLMR